MKLKCKEIHILIICRDKFQRHFHCRNLASGGGGPSNTLQVLIFQALLLSLCLQFLLII